jgi:hypothetical protein
LLISAVSEYGFEIDFPLTPPVWLVITICAAAIMIAHAVFAHRPHGTDKRNTGINWASGASARLEAGWLLVHEGTCRTTAPVAICPEEKALASGALALQALGSFTASDDVPALTILRPAAARGPPGTCNQIAAAPRQPAAQPVTSAHSFPSYLHDSSKALHAFLTSTNQEPILSAIEGDHT